MLKKLIIACVLPLMLTAGIAAAEADAPTFDNLAAVFSKSGGGQTVAADEYIFSDRTTHVFSGQPSTLVGKPYLYDRIDASSHSITVLTAGKVYILTPNTGNNTQVSALTEAGFTCQTVIAAKTVGAKLSEPLAVMEKEVKPRETFTFGKWGILVADVRAAGDPLTAPTVKHAPTEAEYQDGNRLWQGIPGIAQAPNGRLWATWYSGGTGEGAYNWSVLYTSADGENWTGPVTVLDHDFPVRVLDPNLWTDPDGRLWYFWSQSYYHNDGIFGTWAMYTDNPDDAQPTWSEPVRIANGIAMNDPTVLSDGSWLLPTAIWLSGGDASMGIEINSNVYRSTDKGATWKYHGSVQGYEAETRNCDENMLVELSDGRLMMYIRTGLGIEVSYSADGGASWTDSVDAGLSATVSRFYVSRLSSGRLLLICHRPESGTSRSHLTAMLSEDDGASWSYSLLLDARSDISYPDAFEDKDGNIYIIYDRGRYNVNEMLTARITEADIMTGEIVTEGSYLTKVINRNTALGAPVFEDGLALLDSADGTKKTVAVDDRIFSDRTSHKFDTALPASLVGKPYLCSAISGAVQATALTDGKVYVLTPRSGENKQSLALMDDGFVCQSVLAPYTLASTIKETVAVMEKDVKKGDVIFFDRWGILVADIYDNSFDLDGDGLVTVADALTALKALLNNEAAPNGEAYTLRTVIQILKAIV